MKKNFFPLLAALLSLVACSSTFAQGDLTGGGIQFTASSSPAAITFQSALQYQDIGESVKAREALLQAVAQDPKLTIGYLLLTNYGTSPQESLSFLAKAKENLAMANEWEKRLYDYTETAWKGDPKQRLAAARKMVAQFDGKARAYVYLADAYAANNDVTHQRESLQRAVAIEPSWPGAYGSLINSYLLQEPRDIAQAQQTAEKFVGIAPKAGISHILLGDAYRAQNNLTKAGEEYSKVIAMNPSQPMVYYKRGHINCFLGDYEKARADYEQAAKVDLVPTGSRNYIALSYLYEGQPQKAIQSLLNDAKTFTGTMEKASGTVAKFSFLQEAALIAIHIQDANTLQQIIPQLRPLSEEMAKQIGTEQATRNYKMAVMEDEVALNALNKDFAGAKQSAEEIKSLAELTNGPRKLEGYNFVMGYASLLQKDFRKAATHFEQLEKSDVYNQYCLAKAYEGMGEKEKATAIYKSLVHYNFNGIGYALIRNELKRKM